MSLYIGVDIGIKGAVAIIEDDKVLDIVKPQYDEISMTGKNKNKKILNIKQFKFDLLQAIGPKYNPKDTFVGLELFFVSPFAKNRQAALSGGINYGRTWAVLELITDNIKIIAPQTWQSYVFKNNFPRLGLEASGDTKADSLLLAGKLYGEENLKFKKSRVAQDGIADALLIAHYLKYGVERG